jgi:hypothetical protein
MHVNIDFNGPMNFKESEAIQVRQLSSFLYYELLDANSPAPVFWNVCNFSFTMDDRN